MALGNSMGIGIPMVNLGLGASSAVPGLLALLQARATYYENQTCTTAILDKIEKIQ